MSAFGADAAAKFPLGRVLLTRGVRAALSDDDVDLALLRHQCGDWGELETADRRRNESALLDRERIFSVYRSNRDIRFYVITEWDRSLTTLLLPSEY
jgi:hypothetical protein